jgi:hypothetical protein
MLRDSIVEAGGISIPGPNRVLDPVWARKFLAKRAGHRGSNSKATGVLGKSIDPAIVAGWLALLVS